MLMDQVGEALEYETTRKTEVDFYPSLVGCKTEVRHESMWNLLEQKTPVTSCKLCFGD